MAQSRTSTDLLDTRPPGARLGAQHRPGWTGGHGVIFDGLINIVLLLVILVALVVIHEFGHFAMARAAGVRVHEFGVGFPPRARILHRGKDTVYTLNWLPIGGFVRLEGEEGESEDPRAFVNQRLRTRVDHPARRRGHELPAGVAHLLAHRGPRRSGREHPRQQRPAGLAGRDRRARGRRPDLDQPGRHAGLRHLRRPHHRHRWPAIPGVRGT